MFLLLLCVCVFSDWLLGFRFVDVFCTIHYMAERLWTLNESKAYVLVELPIPEMVPFFMTFTLLGGISTRFWSVALGTGLSSNEGKS